MNTYKTILLIIGIAAQCFFLVIGLRGENETDKPICFVAIACLALIVSVPFWLPRILYR